MTASADHRRTILNENHSSVTPFISLDLFVGVDFFCTARDISATIIFVNHYLYIINTRYLLHVLFVKCIRNRQRLVWCYSYQRSSEDQTMNCWLSHNDIVLNTVFGLRLWSIWMILYGYNGIWYGRWDFTVYDGYFPLLLNDYYLCLMTKRLNWCTFTNEQW